MGQQSGIPSMHATTIVTVRKGGKVVSFQRALRAILDTATRTNLEGVKRTDAERAIDAWKKKLAELEATSPG